MEKDELTAPETIIAENLLNRLKQVRKFKAQTAKRIKEQAIVLAKVTLERRDENSENFIHNVDFLIRIAAMNQKIRQFERLDQVEEELLMILGDEDDS